MQSYELCCDMIDVVIDVSCIYGYKFICISIAHGVCNALQFVFLFTHLFKTFRLREDLEIAAFDNQSSSLIKLNNGTILYLREVNKFLALVCILREDNFDRQGRHTPILISHILKENKAWNSCNNITHESCVSFTCWCFCFYLQEWLIITSFVFAKQYSKYLKWETKH